MAFDSHPNRWLRDRDGAPVRASNNALTAQGRGHINCTTRVGRRTSVWEGTEPPSGGQCRLQGRKARALAAETVARQLPLGFSLLEKEKQ
jgi:hypothetical protein